jgi:hypothetical protein
MAASKMDIFRMVCKNRDGIMRILLIIYPLPEFFECFRIINEIL